MTAKANHARPLSPTPVALFGIDSNGKPKAARFGKDHADLAIKAASQLQLRVLASEDPKVAAIVARLPVGRVHATGRTLVPFVRRDLYDKLVAVAPNGNAHQAPPPPAPGAGSTGGAGAPGTPPNLPRNWHEITQGDLVLAQESLEDGWYEAIVIESTGDMLTLRWRDYARSRPITRHRHRLGLLYRETKPATGTGKSAKPAPAAKQDKPTAARESATSPSLPKDWQEINVGHLVLAKDDGPWESWWEAIPIEKAGDGFKLRWRDYATMPPITRPRIELALFCPDAGPQEK